MDSNVLNNDVSQRFINDVNSKHHEQFSTNGIDWMFITEDDGWISIWIKNNAGYWPKIQSKDIEHARSYCIMHEPAPVWLNKLV